MSLTEAVHEIEYPESDGKPMGETDLHRDWMVRILDILRLRYRGQRVYVASDLFIYFEEGDPTQFVAPDDFVVLDCDPGRRRTFKVWEEGGKTPAVVFEVTSQHSRREDEVFKPQTYARLGVPEYFLYDPTSDYLRPPLRGFRLGKEGYARIAPDAAGALPCEQLGITLRLDGRDLVMCDARSGEVLKTEAEAANDAREAANDAREAAEARAAQLEAEVQRLREELRRRGGQ